MCSVATFGLSQSLMLSSYASSDTQIRMMSSFQPFSFRLDPSSMLIVTTEIRKATQTFQLWLSYQREYLTAVNKLAYLVGPIVTIDVQRGSVSMPNIYKREILMPLQPKTKSEGGRKENNSRYMPRNQNNMNIPNGNLGGNICMIQRNKIWEQI